MADKMTTHLVRTLKCLRYFLICNKDRIDELTWNFHTLIMYDDTFRERLGVERFLIEKREDGNLYWNLFGDNVHQEFIGKGCHIQSQRGRLDPGIAPLLRKFSREEIINFLGMLDLDWDDEDELIESWSEMNIEKKFVSLARSAWNTLQDLRSEALRDTALFRVAYRNLLGKKPDHSVSSIDLVVDLALSFEAYPDEQFTQAERDEITRLLATFQRPEMLSLAPEETD